MTMARPALVVVYDDQQRLAEGSDGYGCIVERLQG
jgi:hypothetical protein